LTERVVSSATAQIIQKKFAETTIGAVATGAGSAAATMGLIETNNIFFEALAKETNNLVYGTDFEHPDVSHMINRIKGAFLTGGTLGVALGGGAIATGKVVGALNAER
jgi:hypothetical protein